MARKATTQADFEKKAAEHLAIMEASLRTLRKPLTDDYVCDCEQGNAEGITSLECGCEHREAAAAIEAGGCYIRRGLARGFHL